MTISTKDIIWLAGYLEGEGCFRFSNSSSPVIQVTSTDPDIIQRVASLWNRKIYRYKLRRHDKQELSCHVYGSLAISWMLMIYQFMGSRRQGKICEVLRQWRKSPRKPYAFNK